MKFTVNFFAPVLLALLLLSALSAKAAGEANLEVDSPSIAIIKKSLSARFPALRPWFESGAIGLTRDGLISVSNAPKIQPVERGKVEALVNEDNKDRATLYREIARANGRPDWENDLRQTFGERWISRAPTGWFVKNAKDEWVRK